MSADAEAEWQFWESLSISRAPLSFILDAKKRRERKQMREFSDGAFVHRIFDLLFTMRQDWVVVRLTDEEKRALSEFDAAWSALPWMPLPEHPHVSEVSDEDIRALVAPSRKLDHLLELRTGDTLIPVIYRIFKGWRKMRFQPKH